MSQVSGTLCGADRSKTGSSGGWDDRKAWPTYTELGLQTTPRPLRGLGFRAGGVREKPENQGQGSVRTFHLGTVKSR